MWDIESFCQCAGVVLSARARQIIELENWTFSDFIFILHVKHDISIYLLELTVFDRQNLRAYC